MRKIPHFKHVYKPALDGDYTLRFKREYGAEDKYCRPAMKNKLLFPTREQAEAFIRNESLAISRLGGGQKHAREAYECKACKGWHTTSCAPKDQRTEWAREWRILNRK